MHIHFMGIGGSGMSAVAQIAKFQGYDVSGCDLQTDTYYIENVKNAGIPIQTGHSESHLENSDLLCITPAALYQNLDHPELVTAKNQNKLMTWQEFLGNFLHKDKYLICVAGTHGKSTTTSLAGLLLETAGMDPTVEVGATVTAWHNNVRLGQGKYFISEADEFHDNFASYHPDIILLTLVELDHPEYFGTVDNMLASYQSFINHLKHGGQVIANSNSPLIHKLKLPENTIWYSLKNVEEIHQEINKTTFKYQNSEYQLAIPGLHNVSNSLAIIELSKLLKLNSSLTAGVLASFTGIGRRIENLGTINGITVFDDYANHPSSFVATLSAVRQMHPSGKLFAIIEPHTFSRLRALLPELPASLKSADEVIISKIFASREQDPGDFTGQDIANSLSLSQISAQYIPEFSDIVNYVKTNSKSGDVIVVMGSGNSYKLSRQILESL